MSFLDAFKCGVGFGLGLLLVVALQTLGFRIFARDATDPPGGRSGMAVLRDHGTGREYLMSPTGSLTPRLPSDGVTDGR